jgi:arylsulfatase A-like enzyme
MPRFNVVLLVVDSLRKCSLDSTAPAAPSTPFLSSLRQRTLAFERAYATECWTLPSHMSMFTGLLASQHGAHFQSMQYVRSAPTIAELLLGAGYFTEAITRNSLFDGSVPGVRRGFRSLSRPMVDVRPRDLALHAILALAKPRVRRLIRESGFFHAGQKANRQFLWQLVRMGVPSDRLALQLALDRMEAHRRSATPYFLFVNLYDVHAPYAPTEHSAIPPLSSLRGIQEALSLPSVLPKISSHAYLRDGFRLSERRRQMLLARYHRAIELMDQKLAWFWQEAEGGGLFDDTVVIVTSDHGEAFGEHGLYLHDASVYETHLHVPLWIRWPGIAPAACDDVVSLSGLFDVIRAAAGLSTTHDTLLEESCRARNPAALAEHFYYPFGRRIAARYRQNLAAVIGQRTKIVRRGGDLLAFELATDPSESSPCSIRGDHIAETLRAAGLGHEPTAAVLEHLRAATLAREAA